MLLVTRLVPVARQHLPLLTLLQLGLRLLPAVRPREGAPAGEGHPAHAGQRDPDGHGGQQRRRKCHHGGRLEREVRPVVRFGRTETWAQHVGAELCISGEHEHYCIRQWNTTKNLFSEVKVGPMWSGMRC